MNRVVPLSEIELLYEFYNSANGINWGYVGVPWFGVENDISKWQGITTSIKYYLTYKSHRNYERLGGGLGGGLHLYYTPYTSRTPVRYITHLNLNNITGIQTNTLQIKFRYLQGFIMENNQNINNLSFSHANFNLKTKYDFFGQFIEGDIFEKTSSSDRRFTSFSILLKPVIGSISGGGFALFASDKVSRPTEDLGSYDLASFEGHSKIPSDVWALNGIFGSNEFAWLSEPSNDNLISIPHNRASFYLSNTEMEQLKTNVSKVILRDLVLNGSSINNIYGLDEVTHKIDLHNTNINTPPNFIKSLPGNFEYIDLGHDTQKRSGDYSKFIIDYGSNSILKFNLDNCLINNFSELRINSNRLWHFSLFNVGLLVHINQLYIPVNNLTHFNISGNRFHGQIYPDNNNMYGNFRSDCGIYIYNNSLEGKVPYTTISTSDIRGNRFIFKDFDANYGNYNRVPNFKYKIQQPYGKTGEFEFFKGNPVSLKAIYPDQYSAGTNTYKWHYFDGANHAATPCNHEQNNPCEAPENLTDPNLITPIFENSRTYFAYVYNDFYDFTLLKKNETYNKIDLYTEFDTKVIEEVETKACTECSSFHLEPDKSYVISAWAKMSNSNKLIDYWSPRIKIDFKIPNLPSFSVSAQTDGAVVEGWRRIYREFTVPEGATEMQISLQNNHGNLSAYFDDIRIWPKDGSMKSFVYDPDSHRLVAELDENNYGTFYEYDKEGTLIRVKKETERGVFTIKENRQSQVKREN